jgi:hypothetical protein
MNDSNPYTPNLHSQPPKIAMPQVACQQPKIPMRERLIFLGISLFFYFVALFLPAVVFKDEAEGSWPGFGALAIGWMAPLFGQFGWFAHVPLLVGIILLLWRRWMGTVVCALVASLLALHSISLYWQQVPANEASTHYMTLDHLGAGFYLWLLSIILVGVSALVLRKRERTMARLPHQPYNLPYPPSPQQPL